ncbi:MAG: DUF4440 domain-containing protein [Chitinophagia bacterium]|nr:DUF4440 domain-containing protein [Chitinophagia bacterium]
MWARKSSDIAAIQQLLQAQVAAWNAGSIEGYMHGYWENDSLQFIGSKGPRYGYNVTLQRYKEAYPDSAHMGKLTSVVTRMQRLARNYYFITGTWHLNRSAGDIGGSYTLLMRKIKGKWVIVADHSS